uniref:Alpha-1,4-N-acetylglucosaminyltransferase n=1 Tax=Timema shepardi TaxID=629360 RepID=A0A7R9AUF5_TIMSH|nr:unnamed protein product [Timema shepardi]
MKLHRSLRWGRVAAFIVFVTVWLYILHQFLQAYKLSTVSTGFVNGSGSAAPVVQCPERLIIHCDTNITGYYWSVLSSLPASNTSLELKYMAKPTHVFGQPLSSVFHASDVERILLLMEWGGIFLDTDMLVLRSLDTFRHYEMVVGWPPDQFMGTQILIAHKDARFLPMWLDGYRRYHPTDWYYNAGQWPTEQLLKKQPELVHRVPYTFGVDNFSAMLYGVTRWQRWRTMHTIHLLSRHPPAPQNLDEDFVRHYRSPFGEIARWLLYKLEPKVNFPQRSQSKFLRSSSLVTRISLKQGQTGQLLLARASG